VLDPGHHRWATHRPSHRSVLAGVPLDGPAGTYRFPAVVVPTSRHPDDAPLSGVRTAAGLARHRGSALVLLVSRAAAAPSARARLDRIVRDATDDEVVPVVVAVDGSALNDAGLATAQRPDLDLLASGPVASDVWVKRNAALLLARACGWRRLLFLDDDIRPAPPGATTAGLDAEALDRAGCDLALGGRRAVGWFAEDYPDHSVVCRVRQWSRRRLGAPFPAQEVFLGGGALAVTVDASVPFFPSVYNEDWFFLLGMLRHATGGARPLAAAGAVGQDRPQSGVSAHRARSEEIGDLMAEALMTVASHGGDVVGVGSLPAFWREVLEARRTFVQDLRTVLARLGARHRTDREVQQAVQAVNAALDVHRVVQRRPDDWAKELGAYVEAWARDGETWRDHVDGAARGVLPASAERQLAPALVRIRGFASEPAEQVQEAEQMQQAGQVQAAALVTG
jgi:hypothetical protein